MLRLGEGGCRSAASRRERCCQNFVPDVEKLEAKRSERVN